MFKLYKQAFEKWSKVKALKRSKSFLESSKQNKEEKIASLFLDYLVSNEKHKVKYFSLAISNPCKVIIVKSPSTRTEIKDFLGYDWSNAKGNEGIQYLGRIDVAKTPSNLENESEVIVEEEDDRRILSNIFNLEQIVTPLYDPEDVYNNDKINNVILENFINNKTVIPDTLRDYVTKAELYEMIDFEKIDFNKAISLTPKTTYDYKSRFDAPRLDTLALINPSKTEIKDLGLNPKDPVSFIEMASISEKGYIEHIETRSYNEVKDAGYTYFKKGDILIAKITPSMENGKCALTNSLPTAVGFGSSEFHVIRPKTNLIHPQYIFAVLNLAEVRSAAADNMQGMSGHRRVPEDFYARLKVPVPPEDIQNKIVKKLDKVEIEISKLSASIDKYSAKIESLYVKATLEAKDEIKLNDETQFDLSIGKRVLKKDLSRDQSGIPVYSANVIEPIGFINDYLIQDFEKASILWGIDGDWMVSIQDKGEEFYPTDHCGVLRINSNAVLPRYMVWAFRREGDRVQFSRTNRASLDSVRSLTLKVPPMSKQIKLVDSLDVLEKKIEKAKAKLDKLIVLKRETVFKYIQ